MRILTLTIFDRAR